MERYEEFFCLALRIVSDAGYREELRDEDVALLRQGMEHVLVGSHPGQRVSDFLRRLRESAPADANILDGDEAERRRLRTQFEENRIIDPLASAGLLEERIRHGIAGATKEDLLALILGCRSTLTAAVWHLLANAPHWNDLRQSRRQPGSVTLRDVMTHHRPRHLRPRPEDAGNVSDE